MEGKEPDDARLRGDHPAPIKMIDAAPSNESIRFWRPPKLPGVEVMHVRNSTRLYRLYNETYMFGVLLGGRVDWKYRSEAYTHHAGETILTETGEVYASRRHHGPASWKVLFLDPELLARDADDLGVRQAALHFTAAQVRDPALFTTLCRFHLAIQRSDPALERDSHLAEFVQTLTRRYTECRATDSAAGRDPATVRRAREYLHAHVSENVSLDDLAREVHTSKFHLIRTFRGAVGTPPYAYLIQLRVARAWALLRQGMPIAPTAYSTGFAAQSHLHRHFTRIVGVTPGQYQKAASGG